jgi:hypothetical protein
MPKQQSPDRNIGDNEHSGRKARNGHSQTGNGIACGNQDHADQSRENASKNANPRQHEKRLQDWPAWIQALAAIVTVVMTFFLFAAARNANIVAAQSADAAQKSVELTRVQLRAYVNPIAARLIGNRVRITVKNSGQTPAFNTSIDCEVTWHGEMQATGAVPLPRNEKATLASGEEFYQEHNIDLAKFGKGYELHVYGEVEYTDVFNERLAFPFHFVQANRNAKSMSAVSTD